MYIPVGDYLYVEPVDVERKAKGIYIPEDTAEKTRPREGIIRAIGDGVKNTKFEEGQRVLYKIWGGNIFKDRETDKQMLMVLEEDILAIISETNTESKE